MNIYTSEKYANFTIATNQNNHLLFYYRHRGDRNILIYDDKNFPLKYDEYTFVMNIDRKYKNSTLETFKEDFKI